MKNKIWIMVGIVAVAAVVFISRKRPQREITEKNGAQVPATTPLSASTPNWAENTKDLESVVSVKSSDDAVLSDPVKALLGLDGKEHNYNSLKACISQLSKYLASDDVAALIELLTWPNDRFPEGMRDIQINAVKNDVLDNLLRQSELPEGIGLQIVEMASNLENDPVWRDYCVQFMHPFYQRACSELGATAKQSEIISGTEIMTEGSGSYAESTESVESMQSVDQLKAIQDAMFAALDERDSTIAGTSMIGLELLSRTHDEFDRDTILATVSDIAADESASPASRVTALRLASQTSMEQDADAMETTADTARLLAQTGEAVLLRTAAIVTLGEVGTDEDRELLESFAMMDNQQIADAAKLALKKMDAQQDATVTKIEPEVVEETTMEPLGTQKLPPTLIN